MRSVQARLAGLLCLLLPLTTSAHLTKAALTTVELNARTGLVEVVHRFLAHDAEHAITTLSGLSGDLRSDPVLQDAFARYVAGRFEMIDADGAPIDLELIGAELDGPYLWIYQEAAGDRFDAISGVGHPALQELWGEQINQVNVRTAAGMRTLHLDASRPRQRLPR